MVNKDVCIRRLKRARKRKKLCAFDEILRICHCSNVSGILSVGKTLNKIFNTYCESSLKAAIGHFNKKFNLCVIFIQKRPIDTSSVINSRAKTLGIQRVQSYPTPLLEYLISPTQRVINELLKIVVVLDKNQVNFGETSDELRKFEGGGYVPNNMKKTSWFYKGTTHTRTTKVRVC